MNYIMDYKNTLISGFVVLSMMSCESSWEEAYAKSLNQTFQNGFDCLAQKFKLDKYRSNIGKAYTFGFDYEGEYAPGKVEWDFGDGKTQTTEGLEVTHTFDQPGQYKVTAEVLLYFKGGSCRANKTFTVKVK